MRGGFAQKDELF